MRAIKMMILVLCQIKHALIVMESHGENFTLTHTQDFGSDCLNCHDGSDRMKNFDHAQTGLPIGSKTCPIEMYRMP